MLHFVDYASAFQMRAFTAAITDAKWARIFSRNLIVYFWVHSLNFGFYIRGYVFRRALIRRLRRLLLSMFLPFFAPLEVPIAKRLNFDADCLFLNFRISTTSLARRAYTSFPPPQWMQKAIPSNSEQLKRCVAANSIWLLLFPRIQNPAALMLPMLRFANTTIYFLTSPKPT